MNKQLIIECLQYFPLTYQFKIVHRNRVFKLLMKSTMHFSSMIKRAIQNKEVIEPYYHYLCFINPSQPKEHVKDFMLSLIENYANNNEININLAGTISNDILNRIKHNINIHIQHIIS